MIQHSFCVFMFDDVKVSCRSVPQKSPSVNYGFLSVTAFCRSVFAAGNRRNEKTGAYRSMGIYYGYPLPNEAPFA
jgi:hypothetical protein